MTPRMRDGEEIPEEILPHGLNRLYLRPRIAAAIRTFLGERDDFVADRVREELMLTANPHGFLRRVATPSRNHL